ncbi:hypothetical protein SORBI_3005G045750 [Sorghum bicolor]|uniref:Uncharacterized protein n=1 Tax=Sorghum bicolor TaxID=4558 RepID=A0A1Z5RGM2_SORBI|nr:hypothetical protein SORBI_3005G045750 [Sorghum bicolor]
MVSSCSYASDSLRCGCRVMESMIYGCCTCMREYLTYMRACESFGHEQVLLY